MKTFDKTIKPRHEELNKLLVELGHERHQERKGKLVPRSKQKNAWKREVMIYQENDD